MIVENNDKDSGAAEWDTDFYDTYSLYDFFMD